MISKTGCFTFASDASHVFRACEAAANHDDYWRFIIFASHASLLLRKEPFRE